LSATVLISTSEHLRGLQDQRGLKGAQAFADTDAHEALEVITRERPQLIALERGFASSRRGVALINRVKADPALSSTEIRIVYSRRTPRFRVTRDVQVLIDGNPATVVDISLGGAQVVSLTSLRPNQHVRVSLDAEQGVRFNAAVAWSTYELPVEGPRYRAGVQFNGADEAALTRFIATITE